MNARDLALIGSYDYRLIAVSVVIAIAASYVALDLGGRVTAARRVLIADDHAILSRGLKEILVRELAGAGCGEAEDARPRGAGGE
jgi:hypothetical protein